MRYTTTFILSTVLFLSPSISKSEDRDPSRGRLEDGRAFRVDASGNKLVDYLAELEVNVDALTRQVHGLEDEVQNKQAVIDKLSSGQTGSSVKERDLGSISTKTVSAPVCPTCPIADCSKEVRAAESRTRGDTASVSDELSREKRHNADTVSGYESIIASLNSDLASKKSELESYRVTLAKLQTANKVNAEAQGVDEILKVKNEEVGSLKSKLQKENEASDSLQGELKQKLEDKTALSRQLSSITEELQGLEIKVSDAKDRRSQLQAESIAYERMIANDNQKLEQQRVSLSHTKEIKESTPSEEPVKPAVVEKNTSIDMRASLSMSRAEAVQTLKGELQEKLNSVQGLINQRDALYRSYLANSTSGNMRPTPAISSQKHNMGYLREIVRQSESAGELSQYGREVSEIESKVLGDLALMRRGSR